MILNNGQRQEFDHLSYSSQPWIILAPFPIPPLCCPAGSRRDSDLTFPLTSKPLNPSEKGKKLLVPSVLGPPSTTINFIGSMIKEQQRGKGAQKPSNQLLYVNFLERNPEPKIKFF